MLNNARADAQGALLGCDASVAAEHAAEMAEVGETAASGGLGDTSAAFEHGDRSVEPDARQAGMYRAAVERLKALLQAFFVQSHCAPVTERSTPGHSSAPAVRALRSVVAGHLAQATASRPVPDFPV